MTFFALTPEGEDLVKHGTAILNILFVLFLVLLVPLGPQGVLDIGAEFRYYTSLVLGALAGLFLLVSVGFYLMVRR